MKYAILRIQKLKSGASVRRSLQHSFREKDTPNADPERTPDNSHYGAENVDQALAKFNERLPDKVRKNGVLAVEYLITGSPEAINGKTREEQDAYFADARKWLEKKHGKENVIYAGIHRDETTPHMYAYVVPLDDRGRLNARHFFGEQNALGKMQTDFAQAVGQHHGLERGQEGSKAKHVEIADYYGRVRSAAPKTPAIDLPESKLTEGKAAYGKRCAEAAIAALAPELTTLRAKAANADLNAAKATESERAIMAAKKQADTLRNSLDDIKRETKVVFGVIAQGGDMLEKLREKIISGRESKKQPETSADKGFER